MKKNYSSKYGFLAIGVLILSMISNSLPIMILGFIGFWVILIMGMVKGNPIDNTGNYKKKSRKRIESAKVDEIMHKYKDYSINEKIKFLEDIPYGSYEVAIDFNREDIMHEIELYMEKNGLNLDEYKELEDRLWEYHRESKEDNKAIYDIVSKKVMKEYNTDTVKTCDFHLLSSSNKELTDKIGHFSHLIISKGRLLFLNNVIDILEERYLEKGEDLDFGNLKMAIRYFPYDEYSAKKNIKYEINIKDIICYLTEGSKMINTVISGGGSSGYIDPVKATAMKRKMTVFDNVLPDGDAGAVYSMLKDVKIDPIETKLVENDERVVILKTKDCDFVFKRMDDAVDLYAYLVDKIPEKDFIRMQIKDASKTGEDSKKSNKKESHSNLDEIKKLKELLDMDAITQEEYDKKKKELLK